MLPLLVPSDVWTPSGMHVSRQLRRSKRRCDSHARVVETLRSLNWLGVFGSASGADDGEEFMTGEVRERVDGLVRCRQPTRATPSPEEALRQLLRARSPIRRGLRPSETRFLQT